MFTIGDFQCSKCFLGSLLEDSGFLLCIEHMTLSSDGATDHKTNGSDQGFESRIGSFFWIRIKKGRPI